MSKITFGYSSGEIRDLFSDKSLKIRDLLLEIKDLLLNTRNSHIKINAWYSSDWDGPALRIQLEGDYSDLEKAIQIIIDKEGLPNIIDQPDSTRTKLTKIREIFFGKYSNLSTEAPYNYLMSLYEKNGQKKPKTGFVNKTARAKGFAYHV